MPLKIIVGWLVTPVLLRTDMPTHTTHNLYIYNIHLLFMVRLGRASEEDSDIVETEKCKCTSYSRDIFCTKHPGV